jgi:type VI secretion system protein ImpG
MIEAFAFLAGRVQLKLDDELPEITESFLNVLYPHYLAPIPSMAIAQFIFGSPNDKLTAIQNVERGARLYSRPVDGTPCRFQTSYDVQLVPVESNPPRSNRRAADARGKYADSQIRISCAATEIQMLSRAEKRRNGRAARISALFSERRSAARFPLYELIFNQASAVEFRRKKRRSAIKRC